MESGRETDVASGAAVIPKIGHTAAIQLGRWQAWNDIRTAAPLVLLDIVMTIIATWASVTVATQLGSPPQQPFAVLGLVGLVIFLQHSHGLYPACGMPYSLEYRGILRTCLFVSLAIGFAVLLYAEVQWHGWASWAVFMSTLLFLLSAVRPMARKRLAKFDWWAQPVLIVGGSERADALYERMRNTRHEGLRPVGIAFHSDEHWSEESAERSRSFADYPGQKRGDSKSLLQKRPNDPDHDGISDSMVARSLFSPSLLTQSLLRKFGNDDSDTTSESTSAQDAAWDQIHLGPIADLQEILFSTQACRVAVADRATSSWRDFHAFHGIPHVMLPTELGYHPTDRVRLAESHDGILLHCHTAITQPYGLVGKRVMDLAVVLLSAPFWIPVMLVVIVLMKLTDPGPILYRQTRVGRGGRPFAALKFRSMVVDADRKLREQLRSDPFMRQEWEATHKLKNDPRVTRIGEFLRKTSLDELPQLINVIKGDMSLVGPRPIIDCGDYDRTYIEQYPEVYELYQMVRPGITGLWQVSGRNQTSYIRRVELDRTYLHNWSIGLDIFILWRTTKTAIFREGAC